MLVVRDYIYLYAVDEGDIIVYDIISLIYILSQCYIITTAAFPKTKIYANTL